MSAIRVSSRASTSRRGMAGESASVHSYRRNLARATFTMSIVREPERASLKGLKTFS
jgi:hypothetical protein